MNKLFNPLVILALFVVTGCDIINPAEEIPAYIYVTEFSFSTDVGTEGSSSSRITDVWVSVNNDFIGVYNLPALVPIINKGEQVLTLNAGIKDNGVAATPEIYPFYEPYVITVDLQATEVDTIRPSTRYLEDITFGFIEDFERQNQVFQEELDNDETTRVTLTDEEVFEGNFSGHIRLDTEHPFIEVATIDRYRDLMEAGVFVYLEVNYKSDIPVLFGIVGHDEGLLDTGRIFYDPGFNASEDWKKIYFNLTQLLFDNAFDEYQIVMQSILPLENGQFTLQSADIWLDNIKLVHF